VTARGLFGLVWQNLRRTRRAFALSVFGIAVGIASLTFFLALAAGVRHEVLGRVFPVDQLEVVPAASDLGGGAFGIFSSLGGAKPLDDDAVAALRARPEVKVAFRRMKLAFPARAWGGHELFGRDVYAELIAEGVDAAALNAEKVAPEPFTDALGSEKACQGKDDDCPQGEYCPSDTWRCERPVPAVMSPFMLEIYNGAIAPSHGLPKVGSFLASRFRGFSFNVELGRSMVVGRQVAAEPRARRLMLVGIARRASQMALTVPLGYVQKWNRDFAGEAAAKTYSSILLELKPHADSTRLTAAVRAMGFQVADSGAEKAGLALTFLTLLFALISAAIVIVAAVNIAHSFFRQVAERRREIGVLRAVGASERDVRRIFLSEAAAIGLCGGVAGLIGARLIALGIDAASRALVPDFPFKPESWFSFDATIVAASIGCAIAACLVGAWWPARAAARLDPSEALAS
jgi:putative ABC transport system permease protein